MSLEGANQFSIRNIPDPHRLVGHAGCSDFSAGPESNTRDRCLSVNRPFQLTGSHIPYVKGAIRSASGYQFPARIECYTENFRFCSLHLTDKSASLGVPQPDPLVGAPRRDQPAIRAVGYSIDVV